MTAQQRLQTELSQFVYDADDKEFGRYHYQIRCGIAFNTCPRFPYMALLGLDNRNHYEQKRQTLRIFDIADASYALWTKRWENILARYCDTLTFFATDCNGFGSPLLLMSEVKTHSVRIIDVHACKDVGYVVSKGWFKGTVTAMAAWGSFLAVHTDKSGDMGMVVLLRNNDDSGGNGNGSSWVHVRNIFVSFMGVLPYIRTMSFSADGMLGMFKGSGAGFIVCSTEDGAVVRCFDIDALDTCTVASCPDGWLLTCAETPTVRFLSSDGARYDTIAFHHRHCCDYVAALVPNVGLFVGGYGDYCLHRFRVPHDATMASMSACRVAWMYSVMRARNCVRA